MERGGNFHCRSPLRVLEMPTHLLEITARQLKDIYRAMDTSFTDKNVGSFVDVFDGRITCLEVFVVVVDAAHSHH